MPWQAQLQLHYRLEAQRTVLHHRHTGPLRILKSLYPEGDATCHNVIIHPPGGLVGGDLLNVSLHLAPGTHALVSTPGATRFYASDQAVATQQVHIQLDAGARLEWLPLETIAYPGCLAHNSVQATLAEGAEWLGWDVTALGLPSAGQAFEQGRFSQRLSIPGLWLEQAHIDAQDTRLLNSPLGLDGQRCLGTLWLACGTALPRERREHLLEVVRHALDRALGHAPTQMQAGATCPNAHMLVLRAVAPLVEPLMALFQQVWAELRPAAWGLSNTPPRIWRV
jgi:urease accessory protein